MDVVCARRNGNLTVDAMLQRMTSLALYVLVILSMWVPSPELTLPGWAEPARYAAFIALASAVTLMSYIRFGSRIPVGIETTMLALFFFFYAASALWGAQIADSYIKSLLVLTALVTCLSIANMLSLERSLTIIFYGIATFVLVSVVVVFLWPDIGVDQTWEHGGKWRGIAGQKNGLSTYAAYGAVLGIGLPLALRSTPLRTTADLCLRIALVAICLVAVYKSGSRGGLLLTVLGLGSMAIARMPRSLQRACLLAALALSIPLVFLVLTSISIDGDKLTAMGLTVDTNSRMKLWRYGFEHLQGRMLTGFGMDSFWTKDRLTAFSDIYSWKLDNFHNGYVTLLIETGVLGFTLFVAGFLGLYLLVLICIGTIRTRASILAFALLNMFSFGNLIENELGRSTSLGIYTFLIIAFSLRTHVAGRLALSSHPLPAHPHAFAYGK